MPNTKLSDIEEVPGYEAAPGSREAISAPRLGGSTSELESDYYLGGYDIDSDYPPPHEEEFLNQDQLPPPLPTEEDFPEPYTSLPAPPLVSKEGTPRSSSTAGGQSSRLHFHPSQYLPPHPLPLGEGPPRDCSTSVSGGTPGNGDGDDSVSSDMRLSVVVSSSSDMSVPCELDESGHSGDVEGMNEQSACLLHLLMRLHGACVDIKDEKLKSSYDTAELYAHLKPKFFGCPNEKVLALFFNSKGKHLATEVIGEGNFEEAFIDKRRFILHALTYEAAEIVLAHNHPHAIAAPSPEDIMFTKHVKDMLDPLDMKLVEHMILSDNDYFSMASDPEQFDYIFE